MTPDIPFWRDLLQSLWVFVPFAGLAIPLAFAHRIERWFIRMGGDGDE